jgi:hypothetical protein
MDISQKDFFSPNLTNYQAPKTSVSALNSLKAKLGQAGSGKAKEHWVSSIPITMHHLLRHMYCWGRKTNSIGLIELLGDPDEGQVLKENFRKRLIRQKKAVSKGERGEDFAETRKRFRL